MSGPGDQPRHRAPVSEPSQPSQPSEDELRRRRAEVFGDVLPAGTSDEGAEGWSEDEPSPDAADDWLRRQVPPHHG